MLMKTNPDTMVVTPAVPVTRKQKLRWTLMIAGPLLVAAVGIALWLHSGRFVSTDNAYVKADKISVAPEVSGVITAVKVGDNTAVHQGDVMMTIDPVPFQLEVDRDQAALANVRTQIEDLKARYRQAAAAINAAQANADYYGGEYKRYAPLVKQGVVARLSVEDIARQSASAAEELTETREQQNSVLAQLGGDPNVAVEDHPLYKAAAAQLAKAQRDLNLTTVYAPADGVTGAMPNSGDYAHQTVPSFSIVATGGEWVEANYKETELTDVRVGQPVTMTVDTYPGRTWRGTVDSIAPGTGSEFSILPAQNATGNWVKVIQRVAVRIKIDHQRDEPPLRAGMSVLSDIDVGFYPHIARRTHVEAAQ